MLRQIAFIPQHQFHVLINFKDDERILAILPNEAGRFRVIDQGKVIAEVDCNNEHHFICCRGELDDNIMAQLEQKIKNRYA